VLVAHTTAEFAADHLATLATDPAAVQAAVIDAVTDLLSLAAPPSWVHTHRWTQAKPSGRHAQPFAWDPAGLGIAGDSWCPAGSPRVEGAWLSGSALGRRIIAEIAS
jgi:predicted NAD/FAD-dependent oxidoreductase